MVPVSGNTFTVSRGQEGTTAAAHANAAYVTRESVGSGQLILFASDPVFRAAALGTARVLANAVVCGPGMGASQPIMP